MMSTKKRIDVLLVENGSVKTREKAKRIIMTGIVFVNHQRIDKPGHVVDISDLIEIKGSVMPYVSRGGYKLEKAIQSFDIDVSGKVVMDIGASTGGFTDCLLQNGAIKVYAIDVGYGQLDWRLRNDPRVCVMERTNIRYLNTEKVSELPQIVTIDVSFISLKLVLPVVKSFLSQDGCIITLVKPQFEAGREKVGKKGVIRQPEVHQEVLQDIIGFIQKQQLIVQNITFSPIKGPEGNIEFLLCITRNSEDSCQRLNIEDEITKTIKEAHQALSVRKTSNHL